jgi:hypothetical protein
MRADPTTLEPLRQQRAAQRQLLARQVQYARHHARDTRLSRWLDEIDATHQAAAVLRRRRSQRER